MKKSLVALAVLAASGAAMAQSSVTLYGILDTYLASVKTETAAAVGVANTSLSQTVLNSGAVNGSRWGMKGSEDLGGGLKANFDLQAGIALDTGAGTSAVATAFSRQSWVGFSGGFGAVRLGRTTTPYDDVSGSSNATFDAALAPANFGVFKSTGYSARQDNMFYYQAPNMGGFSGAISYALGENKTATTGATSTTSLNLTYAGGPLAVQFAHQVQDVVNAVPTSADATFTRLGASYNFGAATLKGTYGKAANMASLNGSDATEYQLGVDVPVSAALTVSASFAKSDDNVTAGSASRNGFALAAAYSLSKRTFFYGGFGSAKTTKAGFNDATNTILAAGVQHRF